MQYTSTSVDGCRYLSFISDGFRSVLDRGFEACFDRCMIDKCWCIYSRDDPGPTEIYTFCFLPLFGVVDRKARKH